MILEHEKRLAETLACRVLEAPKLSLWMILIPIFFVFFFMRFQKVTESRKEFVENYLKSRVRALNAAAEEAATGKKPDVHAMASMSDVPEDVRPLQAELSAVLVKHYEGLLRADGADFESLVRSAYRDKTSLLLVYNKLNQAEKKVDAALMPHLEESIEGVSGVISCIESESEQLRREMAEKIFA